MGWWEEDELTLGDEPFDICRCALQQIISKYERHIGRPPTLHEVLVYFRHALNTAGADSLPDLESIEIQSISIKSRKTPKRQSYAIGDYFAIPFDGEYAYAMSTTAPVRWWKSTSCSPRPCSRSGNCCSVGRR